MNHIVMNTAPDWDLLSARRSRSTSRASHDEDDDSSLFSPGSHVSLQVAIMSIVILPSDAVEASLIKGSRCPSRPPARRPQATPPQHFAEADGFFLHR